MTSQHPEHESWQQRRQRMIDEQIRRRGIRCPRLLEAMMAVPRERFVAQAYQPKAYEDCALGVGHGQTISQPFIVAYMTNLLAIDASHRVLEVGTGTGYQTAILAHLARQVYTVERITAMQEEAAARLKELGLVNITQSIGDGTLGLPAHAPFDRIIVTASGPTVPEALIDQLTDDGGRLVLPVGGRKQQTIVSVIRHGGRTIETPMLACRFVKLIGAQGWPEDGEP